jgi:hypothetical protein
LSENYGRRGLKHKYGFDKSFCLWCLCLGVESVEDLKRMLREMGCSDRAVEEILKWYSENNSDR